VSKSNVEVIPPPQSPVAELSNQEYAKILQDVSEAHRTFNYGVLGFYWDLGASVVAVVGQDRPKTYGQQLLAKLSEDLRKYHRVTLGVKSLYHAGTIRSTLTKEELQLALDGKLNLNRVLRLCAQNVPADIRKQLLAENKRVVESGAQFDLVNELKSSLTESRGPDPAPPTSKVSKSNPDKTLPTKPINGVKNIGQLFRKVQGQIELVGECVEEVCSDSDKDDMKKVKDFFVEADMAFTELKDLWTTQKAAAEAAFDKVKDVL
jgi:hypothetical protein